MAQRPTTVQLTGKGAKLALLLSWSLMVGGCMMTVALAQPDQTATDTQGPAAAMGIMVIFTGAVLWALTKCVIWWKYR